MKTQFTEYEAAALKTTIEECNTLMQEYLVSSEEGVKQLVEAGMGADAEIKGLYEQIDTLRDMRNKLEAAEKVF